MGELVPFKLPPGIYRNGTKYETQGRWYDSNLIRWVDGVMQPIGGWAKFSTSALTNKVRKLFAWRTNGGARWLAIATASKLFMTHADGVNFDVTPAGFAVGSDNSVEQLGYGGGNYGAGTYGTPRAGGTFIPPMTWHLDNWGEYLVSCAKGDGKLYEWQLNTGTPAAVITNAPTNCLGVIVTEQRHLMALGAGGNPRKLQWSGKENNTVWTPGAANEAGSIELQTQGSIVSAIRARGQILVVTDTDAHSVQYIGQPLIFGRDRIGLDCGLIGPNAMTLTGLSSVVWMGTQNFWLFDGASVQPIPCEVSDYVFNDINLFQGPKFVAAHNGAFGEVTWYYCSSNAVENDRYVTWNYRANPNHWTIGILARTAWADAGVFQNPNAGGVDNHLYRHEQGLLDDGVSRFAQVFVESGAFELGDGGAVMDVHQVIPDEKVRGEVSVTFKTKYTPTETNENVFGPYLVHATGYTDTRVSGRQMTLKIQPTADADFRVGKLRMNVTSGGGR